MGKSLWQEVERLGTEFRWKRVGTANWFKKLVRVCLKRAEPQPVELTHRRGVERLNRRVNPSANTSVERRGESRWREIGKMGESR